MSTPRRWIAALLFSATLVVAGCSGDAAPTAAPTATPSDAPTGAPAAGVAVRVANIAYDPASLEVPVGTTVTWTNEDAAVRHTATSGVVGTSAVPGVSQGQPDQPDGQFDLDMPTDGVSVSHTFAVAGTYPYYCDVHPSMSGEVVVS